MKNTLILFMAFAFSITLFAQTNNDEIELLQTIYGMEKKAVVAGFIKIDEAKKEAFWALYDSYEAERKSQGKAYIKILQRYVEKYDNLNDENAATLMKDNLKHRKQTEKLLAKYYKQFTKLVGAKQAAQFFQLESYFLNINRVQLMETIPFIGELDEK